MSADFLDSNVLLYLFDDIDARKRQIAETIVTQGIERGTATISVQVVQETLNVLIRKLDAKPRDARRFLDEVLEPLWRVAPTAQAYAAALDLVERYRYGFYDASIISSALQAGCRRLLTEDLQHGQRIRGLEIIDPFREA